MSVGLLTADVAAPSDRLSLSPQEERVVEAALRCVARWGAAKTSLDDVARQAGLSRATVYRLFPGGRDGLLEVVAEVEIARFFAAVVERLEAAQDLEELLVTGMAEAGRRILEHDALQFLLAHEPEVVVPRLAFRQLDVVLRTAAIVVAPHLERWLPSEDALRAAEWITRLVLSYASTPAGDLSIGDEASVRRLVRAFVLPGLLQHVS
jgi:AcrR family transcriptional regulator